MQPLRGHTSFFHVCQRLTRSHAKGTRVCVTVFSNNAEHRVLRELLHIQEYHNILIKTCIATGM